MSVVSAVPVREYGRLRGSLAPRVLFCPEIRLVAWPSGPGASACPGIRPIAKSGQLPLALCPGIRAIAIWHLLSVNLAGSIRLSFSEELPRSCFSGAQFPNSVHKYGRLRDLKVARSGPGASSLSSPGLLGGAPVPGQRNRPHSWTNWLSGLPFNLVEFSRVPVAEFSRVPVAGPSRREPVAGAFQP